MSLKIVQESHYLGDGYWNWSVWIEGADDELNQIDMVIYTLHHTFPRPVRTVKERETKFRLMASGWGVFRIYARAILSDGTVIRLNHFLQLEYPDGKKVSI